MMMMMTNSDLTGPTACVMFCNKWRYHRVHCPSHCDN